MQRNKIEDLVFSPIQSFEDELKRVHNWRFVPILFLGLFYVPPIRVLLQNPVFLVFILVFRIIWFSSAGFHSLHGAA
jgi:hypothetical protein